MACVSGTEERRPRLCFFIKVAPVAVRMNLVSPIAVRDGSLAEFVLQRSFDKRGALAQVVQPSMLFEERIAIANRVMMTFDEHFPGGSLHNAGGGKWSRTVRRNPFGTLCLRERAEKVVHFVEAQHGPVWLNQLAIKPMSFDFIAPHGCRVFGFFVIRWHSVAVQALGLK